MKDEIRKLEEVIEAVRVEIRKDYTVTDEALEVLSKIQQDLLQARDRLKYYNQ
jgi:hypothetical protein